MRFVQFLFFRHALGHDMEEVVYTKATCTGKKVSSPIYAGITAVTFTPSGFLL